MKNKLAICLFILSPFIFIRIVSAGEGHDAGKKWAEKKKIDDESDCYSKHKGRWKNDYISNSQSFTEGCLQHVEEIKEERKNENVDKE